MTNADRYLEPHRKALVDAAAHARSVYPEESCGFIVNGRYVPALNRAGDPASHRDKDRNCDCRLCAFRIASEDYLAAADGLQMIVHSHPNGPDFPSQQDMAGQMETGVAWVILTLDETRFGPITVWGGDCPIEPILGREFIHGINDCYSLVADTFALGREKLAEQGIAWPFEPIKLMNKPRADGWWLNDTDNNLYEDNIKASGFVEISREEARPGDAFLGRIRSDVLNHAGLLMPNNLIMHHLPGRLSRREPSGIWHRSAVMWLRYQGVDHA